MINLHKTVIKALVNTLVADDPESNLRYLQSINNESGKGTQNSKHQRRWDYRYNSIIQIAEKFELEYIKLDRGNLWEAVLIVGPENELYVFFSHKNMRQIIKKGKNNHYLKLLNLFNSELNRLEPLNSQMELPLFPLEDRDENKFIEQAKIMVKMMKDTPSKVIMFAFDHSFISTVKAYAFNTRHETVWEDNLSELIEPNYRLVLKDDKVQPHTQERKSARKTKKKKQIVNLKNIK